ncbi:MULTISPECIES: hypothetical protein [Sphingomonadaceae]|uniref:hypothetical protein n=1 Tax=Sphingomonadales TaxID=204457 RepID=UPI001CCD609A|nr:hypothetical protein [Sphingobium sp. 3R8]MBZ9647159.1 hypothetical protein [Sphingobium sp. 3R8]
MAETQRKYLGSLTLGKLEIALEAHEQLFGAVTALEALLGQTVATFDDGDFPALSSLVLMPRIGGHAPPPPAGTTHLLDGDVTIVGQAMGVSVYRAT